MNTTQIYQNAISIPKETEMQQERDDLESKEQYELRLLNWNLQQTTKEMIDKIHKRISDLDIYVGVLSQKEGNSYNINRSLMERHTLTKILDLLKTGIYYV